MPVSEIEIVVQGEPGSGAEAAAYVTARALEAEGVFVNMVYAAGKSAPPLGVLRGVRALVRVEAVQGYQALAGVPFLEEKDHGGVVRAVKISIGALLLLMLLGVEVRLRFGLRLDTIVTLGGAWAFWHYCLRSERMAA